MIGRHNEVEELERLYNSKEAEFLALYGRRRVGKTYLIRETFDGRFTFSHTGLANKSRREQLKHFTASINEHGGKAVKCPGNWMEAFALLKNLIVSSSQRRKVVFIDEMPWLDTPKSGFLTELEAFWNGWCSERNDILFIVCGSASSWIIKHLFRNKGGLHNRITARMNLLPFTLRECEEYACERGLTMARKDIAECYMALGGIPYYWRYLLRGLSLAQNFDRLFFSLNAPMKQEYHELYSSLFKNADIYEKVVKALSKRNTGATRSEIAQALGRTADGKLTDVLETLECSGFIRKYMMPASKKRNCIYQLMDNFTLFHFRFLEQEKSDENYWENTLMSQAQTVWKGLAFEHICLQHLAQLRKALGINGIHTEAYAWRHKPDEIFPQGVQIDLILERADNVVNICEMKYTDAPYAIDAKTLQALLAKIATFRDVTHTRKALHLTMICANGLVHNACWNSIQAEISLDSLFDM